MSEPFEQSHSPKKKKPKPTNADSTTKSDAPAVAATPKTDASVGASAGPAATTTTTAASPAVPTPTPTPAPPPPFTPPTTSKDAASKAAAAASAATKTGAAAAAAATATTTTSASAAPTPPATTGKPKLPPIKEDEGDESDEEEEEDEYDSEDDAPPPPPEDDVLPPTATSSGTSATSSAASPPAALASGKPPTTPKTPKTPTVDLKHSAAAAATTSASSASPAPATPPPPPPHASAGAPTPLPFVSDDDENEDQAAAASPSSGGIVTSPKNTTDDIRFCLKKIRENVLPYNPTAQTSKPANEKAIMENLSELQKLLTEHPEHKERVLEALEEDDTQVISTMLKDKYYKDNKNKGAKGSLEKIAEKYQQVIASLKPKPIQFYKKDEEYDIFSNVSNIPVKMTIDGEEYHPACSEAIFQGLKGLNNSTPSENAKAKALMKSSKVGAEVQQEGQQIQRSTSTGTIYDELFDPHDKNPNGLTVKERINDELELAKVTQNPELCRALLATGDTPLEENTRSNTRYNDSFWGNGWTLQQVTDWNNNDRPKINAAKIKTGLKPLPEATYSPGRNALGKSWERVRSALQLELATNGFIARREGFSKALADRLKLKPSPNNGINTDPTTVITKTHIEAMNKNHSKPYIKTNELMAAQQTTTLAGSMANVANQLGAGQNTGTSLSSGTPSGHFPSKTAPTTIAFTQKQQQGSIQPSDLTTPTTLADIKTRWESAIEKEKLKWTVEFTKNPKDPKDPNDGGKLSVKDEQNKVLFSATEVDDKIRINISSDPKLNETSAKIALSGCEPPIELNSVNKTDILAFIEAAKSLPKPTDLKLTGKTMAYINSSVELQNSPIVTGFLEATEKEQKEQEKARQAAAEAAAAQAAKNDPSQPATPSSHKAGKS